MALDLANCRRRLNRSPPINDLSNRAFSPSEQIRTDPGAGLRGRPDNGRDPEQPETVDHAKSVLLYELFPKRTAGRGLRLCFRKDRRPHHDGLLGRPTEGALSPPD